MSAAGREGQPTVTRFRVERLVSISDTSCMLRWIAFSVLLATLVLAPAVLARQARSFRGSDESRVVELLNGVRRQHHLAPLHVSVALRSAAREHSADMLKRQYFEHDSPSESFDRRIGRHLRSRLVGEDIAWGTGVNATPEGIVRMWVNSPTHLRIILTSDLRRVGLGIAMGTFEGNADAAVATADFAS